MKEDHTKKCTVREHMVVKRAGPGEGRLTMEKHEKYGPLSAMVETIPDPGNKPGVHECLLRKRLAPVMVSIHGLREGCVLEKYGYFKR